MCHGFYEKYFKKGNWLAVKSIPEIKAESFWAFEQLYEYNRATNEVYFIVVAFISDNHLANDSNESAFDLLLNKFVSSIQDSPRKHKTIRRIQEDTIFLNLHLIDFMPVHI